MRIAVLFDGAGLARLGLESVGFECTGFELDPVKHYLSTFVGSGRCVLADALTVDLSRFDGVWGSPPCQRRSRARTQGEPVSTFGQTDLVDWTLSLPHPLLWVENVEGVGSESNTWGTYFNAAQFEPEPIQNRIRLIGGRYPSPVVFRPYARRFPGVCPAITATEHKGCASDSRRASRYYGRRLTLDECAARQGFLIPQGWRRAPEGWSRGSWERQLYEAVGNGVPVYMARGFGLGAASLRTS